PGGGGVAGGGGGVVVVEGTVVEGRAVEGRVVVGAVADSGATFDADVLAAELVAGGRAPPVTATTTTAATSAAGGAVQTATRPRRATSRRPRGSVQAPRWRDRRRRPAGVAGRRRAKLGAVTARIDTAPRSACFTPCSIGASSRT
ncbi:MAG: hypothetical protein ACYCUG_12520, partial [Acidimicrobiales bacterium]